MLLNGGRWLFGADNLYRLSHLIGENFSNVIPGEFHVQFNLRFSTELKNDAIVQRVSETLD